jgi:hypothetical protein
MSVLVLTEDGANDAFETVAAISKKLFQALVPRVATNRIRFEPSPEAAHAAVTGNRWRGTAPEDDRLRRVMLRSIATKLLEGDGFVLFHYDGDTVWSKRDRATTGRQFEQIVREGVRRILLSVLEKRGSPGEGVEAEASGFLSRLREIVPHYSIEAWLYQNTRVAIDLCKRECGRHEAQFRAWEADRSLLDEVDKPKEVCCLGSRHNRELAAAFPTPELLDAGGSFFHAAMHLLECDFLATRLGETAEP